MLEREVMEGAFAAKERMVEIRRDIHRHPELSQKEFRTQQKIIEELRSIGITEMKKYYNTGLAAVIRGAAPGKTIGMRADMDALPIEETTGLPFASQNPGVSHSCGHDGHVAMLLGAARVLYALRDRLRGNVKLIFQPAEEDGLNGGGSQWMVREGVMTNEPAVDFIIGQHVAPHLEAGVSSSKAGPFFTTSDLFTIEVIGREGHSSAPQNSRDPVVAAAQIVLALQTIVSRSIDPQDTAVLSIGIIEGGARHNIIPARVRLVGGARSYTEEISATVRKRMREIVSGVAAAMDLSAEIAFKKSYGPVVNDEGMFGKCRAWAGAVLEPGKFVEAKTPNAAGEDFSNFTSDTPGVYFLVGARCARGEQFEPHTGRFTFNEDALPWGAVNLCAVAVNYLNENA